MLQVSVRIQQGSRDANDALGNVKTISGQFKKSDLVTEHRLNVIIIFPT